MNEIDELMSKDPLQLSSQDLDTIIAYQRKARAQFEGGAKKPKKAEATGGMSLVDALKGSPIKAIAVTLSDSSVALTTIKRRF